MKKILGISLCALFAVSAANANIAAQSYVDGINTNLGARITENAGDISDNTTAIGNNASAITTINTKIANMAEDVTTNDFIQGVVQANGTVTATGADFADTVTAEGTIAPTSAAVATHVEGAINALDVDATNGQFVTRISQVDGKISAGSGSFAGDVTTGGTTAPTSAAVVTYVEGAITGATGELGDLAHQDTVAAGDFDAGAIMNADINANAEIASTKIKFTDTQNTVFGSGIDSTKVGQIATNTGAIAGINTAIEGMELTQTGDHYVKFVAQAGGQVSATTGTFEETLSPEITNNAPSSKAVANYVADNAIQGVTTGGTDGTILVDNQEVAVKGLQAMAYKAAVTSTEITDGAIMNADINANAEIETSKIAFTDRQENALNSGITSTLVGQISTNKTNIETMTGYMTPRDSAACAESGCTLVYKNGNYSWEAIKR